ncbi:MAG: glycosyltransferase family 4 protein [Halieaceae bacterium]
MKVLVVGVFKENPSEGMEVITAAIVNSLQEDFGANVAVYSTRTTLKYLTQILHFKPQVIVFTHGPGIGVLLLSRLLHCITGAKIIWVASRPSLTNVPSLVLRSTHVDHILLGQSNKQLSAIQKHTSAQLHNIVIGIDFGRIQDRKTDKQATRSRILGRQCNASAPLLLHVGHIRHNRGLDKLVEVKELMGASVEIVIVGSPALTADQALVDKLKAAEISVYREFSDDLGSIYDSADYYVFPLDPNTGGAVDLPLSVLEALASGTPVLSTRFGALPHKLKDVRGIVFSNYCNIVDMMVEHTKNLPTGQVVDPLPPEFDLRNVAQAIIELSR